MEVNESTFFSARDDIHGTTDSLLSQCVKFTPKGPVDWRPDNMGPTERKQKQFKGKSCLSRIYLGRGKRKRVTPDSVGGLSRF